VTAGYTPVSPRLTDNWEERYIVGRLKSRGVTLLPTTWLRRFDAGRAVLYDIHTGAERTEEVDALVLVTGRVPCDALARQLQGRVAQLFTIGDALAPRMLAAASYEGQKFARLIGEPDAPASVMEAWLRPDAAETAIFPADVPRPHA